ncbi:hypothetical protein GGR50DRAFT_481305 [Xylaria sp. CBS 124048]|nr:hypothetical protein GGR50DRAFT_481305 [Xylaria sp. CBS 124048]
MAHNNGSWSGGPPAVEECAPQIRPMGLKVHYTFDKDNQERCLARWPNILHIQTIPVDGQTIGVVDLAICLQAVSQCSPELTGDEEKDYAVYAFDYSEPDTPLVGQGLLSRELSQAYGPQAPKLITGRVTKNLLAIFGNGIKETLEVRLKLTVISKVIRHDSISRPHSATARPMSNLPAPSSAVLETGEWNSFVQSHPGLGQKQPTQPMNLPTLAPAPVRPGNSSFEARNESPHHFLPLQPAPSSRPGSVDPSCKERITQSFGQPLSLGPTTQSPAVEESGPGQPPTKPTKPQTQSRPNSRASSRPPTGRPRGRPRKRPLASEGNTSGYEDGTDGDDAPTRAKKRATMTKVEQRSNAATFGTAPESLRVAASTAGSIRNFRPVAPAGDASRRSHLQEEGPRAPTPIPGHLQGPSHSRTVVQSTLGQQRMSFQQVASFGNAAYLDTNRSMSQDARSPVDSAAPSPFSDEPSPADISSSPPVPRLAAYRIQSSPAPSSPVLPPMRVPSKQPDSGFMSGEIEDNRIEADSAKIVAVPIAPAPAVPKPKPRRSRAKKQEPKSQQTLHIHTETPGPPELLPQTSIYNPPRPLGSRKRSTTSTPVATAPPAAEPINTTVPVMPETVETGVNEPQTQSTEHSQAIFYPQSDFDALQAAINDYPDDQRFLGPLDMDVSSFSPDDDTAQQTDIQPSGNLYDGSMEPPTVPTPASELLNEPELPAVPASDPVLPQLPQSVPMSGGPHPQTDAVDGMESRMNKNYVKRQAIKQKLEEAVALGEMPSFCSNCGALQTPTWRKIWKQERRGVPTYHEYSEKPGHVTAINVLERDDDGKPTSYEVIKKSLGPTDDKTLWAETILCNPCGIWFSKWKAHRPPEKWEKDEQRLTQTRKKRAAGGASRSRKSRAKSEGQTNPASEACLPTDPAGPSDAPQSPKESNNTIFNANEGENTSDKGPGRTYLRTAAEPKDQGSTHSRVSRASGTAMTPIDLDEELGATRRLLFPSPRKNGEQRVLGEVAVNIVQTAPKAIEIIDEEIPEKKNSRPSGQSPELPNNDLTDLFGPNMRPSTPPPNGGGNGPFKTPTRPTPSHRPITRSVSRSMRSIRSLVSPSQGLLERTPTRTPSRTPRKTPRSAFLASATRRRSPRHLLPSEAMAGLGTPLTNSIHQMFSDADHLDMPSPSRSFEIDFSSLPHIDNIDQHSELPHFDFATLLATGPLMPSSPPPLRNGEHLAFGGSLEFEIDSQDIGLSMSPTRRGGGLKHSVNKGEFSLEATL